MKVKTFLLLNIIIIIIQDLHVMLKSYYTNSTKLAYFLYISVLVIPIIGFLCFQKDQKQLSNHHQFSFWYRINFSSVLVEPSAYQSQQNLVLTYLENMDYSKTTLLSNSSHTPAPMPVNYPLQEAHPGYNRLPSIPENVVHPPHSDTRQVFQQPSYEVWKCLRHRNPFKLRLTQVVSS